MPVTEAAASNHADALKASDNVGRHQADLERDLPHLDEDDDEHHHPAGGKKSAKVAACLFTSARPSVVAYRMRKHFHGTTDCVCRSSRLNTLWPS
jgi:hypothetical protein